MSSIGIDYITLICNHVFHHNCIKKLYYLYLDNRCPMCRRKFSYKRNKKRKANQKLLREIIKNNQNESGVFTRDILMEMMEKYKEMKIEIWPIIKMFKILDYMPHYDYIVYGKKYMKITRMVKGGKFEKKVLCNSVKPDWNKCMHEVIMINIGEEKIVNLTPNQEELYMRRRNEGDNISQSEFADEIETNMLYLQLTETQKSEYIDRIRRGMCMSIRNYVKEMKEREMRMRIANTNTSMQNQWQDNILLIPLLSSNQINDIQNMRDGGNYISISDYFDRNNIS